MRTGIALLALILAGQAMAQTAPPPAAAAKPDFTVVRSDAPHLPPDSGLARGAVISIDKSQQITLVERAGGLETQRICVGPYNGAVENCAGQQQACGVVQRMTGNCPNGAASGGAPGASRGPAGGTRGFNTPQ
jgi:hypothetical protein